MDDGGRGGGARVMIANCVRSGRYTCAGAAVGGEACDAATASQPSHIFTLRLIAPGALLQPRHHRLFRSNGVPKVASLALQPSHTGLHLGIVHTTLCGSGAGGR